ncbi:hypothetical protein ACFFGH_06170 [Lysobacter korlensis]|uniref:AMIN domain-containing protein n=1 Tax=Lysobacter korlensis TaxID=553636 RepID=A0ABV6RNB9_9GAMM
MATSNRLRLLSLSAALVFAVAAAPACAEPSNKWRIQVSSDADSAGVMVFDIVPVNAPPRSVTVQIPDDAGENEVADLIRDALRVQIGDAYNVEVDDGEDVLVKKQFGAADFDLRLRETTVRGVRINLDRE